MVNFGTHWKQKKPRSAEHREKQRIAITGKKLSDETKRKIGNAIRGRHQSEETKKKIGDAQRLDKNHNWKGGRYTNKKMYVRIKAIGHPNADKRGYVAEHRLIMEMQLKRFLTKEEEVHHIDTIRNHNAPDNLMLFANHSEHEEYHRQLGYLK